MPGPCASGLKPPVTVELRKGSMREVTSSEVRQRWRERRGWKWGTTGLDACRPNLQRQMAALSPGAVGLFGR